MKTRNYYEELKTKCEEADAQEAFTALFDLDGKDKKAITPLYETIEALADKLQIENEEFHSIEDIMFNSLNYYEESGFNSGYEIGFNKGVLEMAKQLRLNDPHALDAINTINKGGL